jgi:very-short-patch-repair endonuclease
MRALSASALKGDAAFEVFVEALASEGIVGPHTEYRFAPPRRWRFDYAWPTQRIALEVEGGAWTRGRHTRGKGFIADMEKYNVATVMGWRLLRVTPDQLLTETTIERLRTLFSTPPMTRDHRP